MTRHEYTKDEITPVLAFRKEGYTYTKISNITKIPISTVRWLVKKHAKDSCAKLKAPNRRGKDKGLALPHKTTMKAALCQDIIKDYLLPHYKIGNIFQQNNAPYHTTKEVLNFFRDHDVTVMDWPAQSPDLNPIENVWHILNLAIDKRMSKIHSYERLEEVVREEWEIIDKKMVINFIESMPKRCAEVIKAHGGSINY